MGGKSRIKGIGLVLLLTLGLFGQAANPKKFKILILGDSLTEGYGVEKEDAFPARMEALLRGWQDGGRARRDFQVINGGSSGSTSAGGVSRLKWYEKTHPDLVVLALGSNDGLRGVKVEETRKNVEAAIVFCKQRGWQVVLVGLKVPPNYGAEYAGDFERIFPGLAQRHGLPLLGFLLEGVAGEPGLNQADGIHPNEKGHQHIAESLFRFLKPRLSAAAADSVVSG
jgi:acyl-CoA thioesterase I